MKTQKLNLKMAVLLVISLMLNYPRLLASGGKSIYCYPFVNQNSGLGIEKFSLNQGSLLLQSSSPYDGFSFYSYSNTVLPIKVAVNFELKIKESLSCDRSTLLIFYDINQDHDFEDLGEKLFEKTFDNPDDGLYSSSFEIPGTTNLGISRMRVIISKSADCGYQIPGACGDTSEAIQGEVEDYELTVTSASGYQYNNSTKANLNIYPNPCNNFIKIKGTINGANRANLIQIYSLSGELIREYADFNLDSEILTGDLSEGTYLIKIVSESEMFYKGTIVKLN